MYTDQPINAPNSSVEITGVSGILCHFRLFDLCMLLLVIYWLSSISISGEHCNYQQFLSVRQTSRVYEHHGSTNWM